MIDNLAKGLERLYRRNKESIHCKVRSEWETLKFIVIPAVLMVSVIFGMWNVLQSREVGQWEYGNVQDKYEDLGHIPGMRAYIEKAWANKYISHREYDNIRDIEDEYDDMIREQRLQETKRKMNKTLQLNK